MRDAGAARGGGSLLSVVVKEPLRRSGWVDVEPAREAGEGGKGEGDSASHPSREPSLLSVVVKRPLREFVWGPGHGGGSQAAANEREPETGTGGTGRGEKKVDEHDDGGVLQSGTHWGFGLNQESAEQADADTVSVICAGS